MAGFPEKYSTSNSRLNLKKTDAEAHPIKRVTYIDTESGYQLSLWSSSSVYVRCEPPFPSGYENKDYDTHRPNSKERKSAIIAELLTLKGVTEITSYEGIRTLDFNLTRYADADKLIGEIIEIFSKHYKPMSFYKKEEPCECCGQTWKGGKRRW